MSQPSAPSAPSAAEQPEPRLGVVSFDFGTTASTATMRSQLQGAPAPMDPDHVQTVRSRLIELIESDWPQEEPRDRFVQRVRERKLLRDKAADDMARGLGPDIRPEDGETERGQLVRWLREESPADVLFRQDLIGPPRTEVLDAVWVTLAEFFGQQHEALANWGNQRLHATLHEALRQPAFTQSNLIQVPLEGEATPQVDSVLVVRNQDIGTGELSGVAPEAGALAFRGLKRRIVKPVLLPPGLRPSAGVVGQDDSDVLVGQAYRSLEKKVLGHAAARLHARGHKLGTVIVTYPTATPPAVRARLAEIVKKRLDCSGLPVMNFDEGIAALLFVLMRDFGGENEVGIETFRARSRLVGAGHWRQNLLVIDIGGGTTDITLARLDLRNLTPGVDKAAKERLPSGPDGAVQGDPRVRGRVYELKPEVLGSTGHQQYGGDLLTLRVFYWIKACLADTVADAAAGRDEAEEVLHGWPGLAAGQRPSLARAIVDYPEPGPGPGEVVGYLRAALPTRNEKPSARVRPYDAQPYDVQLSRGFTLLWQTAEKAKQALAARKPYDLRGAELADLVKELGGGWKPRFEELITAGKPVQLTVEDFDRLARSVLTPSVQLAVDLARRLLAGNQGSRGNHGDRGEQGGEDERDQLLDGIALTGRAAGSPLVRELMLEQLSAVFGDRNRGGKPMAWNPALVTTEHAHPKQAASIGACWARVQYEDLPPSLAEIALSEKYRAGRDQLIINVNNLVGNLPCRFGLGAADQVPLDLLPYGHPLEHSDAAGHRFARSAWQPAYPDIRLLRFLDQRMYVQWGHYNIDNRLGTTVPVGLRFQIEINDELVPTLHLSMGHGKFALEGTEIGHQAKLPADCLGRDRKLTSLPWDISVRAEDETTGDESWETVIEHIPTVTAVTFDKEFVPVADPRPGVPAQPVAAKISRQLPPPTRASGANGASGQLEYVFAGTFPGETERRWIAAVPVTRQPGADPVPGRAAGPHWAVLDAAGRLFLQEPGYPRYQRAASAQMMLTMPGTVLTTPMEPPQPDMRADWDPFTGEH